MRPGNMALVFTVRNTLLGSIASSADGGERIFSLQLHSSVVLVSLITAYAPSLSSLGKAKDKLYHELAITIKGITEKELLTVHSRWLQRQSWCWSKVMAHLLGSFRQWEDERKQPRPSRAMPSSQTLFQERVPSITSPNTVSWRHPRSKHRHQFDLILTRHQLSECWMRYESLLGVQQSKIAIKVTVSHKKGGEASLWHEQIPSTR